MKFPTPNKNGFLRALYLLAVVGIVLSARPAWASPPLPIINTNNIVVITNATYGAVGDGVADNTMAISNAITKAASGGTTNGLVGGTVEIPPGIFLSGPLLLKSSVNLQIDSGAILRMLPFNQYPKTWVTNGSAYWFINVSDFVGGSSLTNIEISGFGAIDGQGAPWWPWANTNNADRPRMISPSSSYCVLIQNVTLSNSPMFHIALSGGGNVTVSGVIIRAPSSSDPVTPGHNTDACDVSGTNILVQNNDISVGDDNYTCGGSTSGVLITNNTYGNGHGVSIGSYTSPSVSNLTVINCTFTNTDAALRIKTDRDRGGFVHNISYYNFLATNVLRPILIYCEYTNKTIPSLDSITPAAAAALTIAPITSTTPYYRDITISNFVGNAQSGRTAGLIWGLPESSISNLTMVKVHVSGSTTFGIYDAQNVKIIDSSSSVPAGIRQFSFFNASVTFSNSTPSSTVVTLDGATANSFANSFTFYNSTMTLVSTNALALNSAVTLGASTFIISNNLTMTPSNSFNYCLGTNAATVIVKGNLTLGGTNNIYAGNGFTNGTYALMTYTGTLSGSAPTLGSVPFGYNYALNTATTGQVNLVVSPTAAPTNLVATATNLLINLTWNSVSGATSYNLKRGTTSGIYPTIFSGLTTTNYADANVTNTVNYFYVVSASSAGIESSNSLQVATAPLPSNQPTNLMAQVVSNQLQLAWPQDHLGWRLQIQTNTLSLGISTNWATVAYSTNVIATNIIISPTNGSVFLRLIYP